MTSLLRSLSLVLVLSAGTLWTPASALAQPPQQEEFIPIDQLPEQEQLPAAPLLVGAYIFALVALVAYLVSVSRRLRAVQDDVARLEKEIGGPGGR